MSKDQSLSVWVGIEIQFPFVYYIEDGWYKRSVKSNPKMTAKAAKRKITICVAAFKCRVMGSFLHLPLSIQLCKNHPQLSVIVLFVINSQDDNKGDWGFSQCIGLQSNFIMFWFCSDLYVSGDENLAVWR